MPRPYRYMTTPDLIDRIYTQERFVKTCEYAGFCGGSSLAAERQELDDLVFELELRWQDEQ